MVFRLLTIGLCGACLVLLATFEPVRVVAVVPGSRSPPASRSPPFSRSATPTRRAQPLSVIDVASTVTLASIPQLLHLGGGEWVSAVNDQAVDDVFQADELISAFARRGSFLDLTVTRGDRERRVLLLIH